MTYIVAGKLKNSSFLVADCIVNNAETSQKTFIDKVSKLDSSENLFYSLTGIQFIDNAVRSYDWWLHIKNRNNDFIKGMNSFNELLLVIQRMVDSFSDKESLRLGINRLFFIDKNGVVYYNLNFNDKNKLEQDSGKKHVVEMNHFITSAIDYPQTELKEKEDFDLKKFYSDALSFISKGKVDFKDRLTFVQIFVNGDTTINRPFKRFSDMIAMYNEIDFDKIDDANFIWDI
jgi:hypothetical protein